MQLFRKNKLDVDFDRIDYDFVKRHEDIEEGSGVLEQMGKSMGVFYYADGNAETSNSGCKIG